MNEDIYVQKCQNGDLDKFAILYDLYIKKIFDFVYFKTHHKQTAEDITSKVFIKAIKSISGFDSKKAKFSTWLYSIARNAVIDHYRVQKNNTNIEDVWDLDSSEDLEKDFDIKNKISEVEKYIKELKPIQREIIIMRIWQQMSYDEIVEVTGKTKASCKMTFSRSMKKLRDEIPLSVLIAILCTRL